jgi:hypothetical protein
MPRKLASRFFGSHSPKTNPVRTARCKAKLDTCFLLPCLVRRKEGRVTPANLDIENERIGDAGAVKNLRLGNFVAWNRLLSGRLIGKVF